MKIKLSSFSFLILWVSVASSHLSAGIYDNSPETIYPELKDIYKKAELNSHSYKKMDLDLYSAQLQREINLSDRRPSVNLSTGAGGSWNTSKDTLTKYQKDANGAFVLNEDGNKIPVYDENGNEVTYEKNPGIQAGIYDLSLSTYYSLYTWGSKQAHHRMAHKGYENRMIRYKNDMSSIARDIRDTYMQLIIDKFALRIFELESSIVQSNIDQDSVRHEEGRLSNDNYQRSMNSRKMRLMDIEEQRRNINRRVEDFNRMIGVNELTVDQIPASIPKVKNINEEIIALARQSESKNFSDLPSIQSTQNNIDVAEDSIIASKSLTKPSVGLSGGLKFDIEPTAQNERVWEAQMGLGIGWNIYSGGANKKRLLKAYNQKTAITADYLEQISQLKIDVQRKIESLRYRAGRLEIAESEYQLALQNYEKSKDEYDRGRISDLHFQSVELSRLQQEQSIYVKRKQYIQQVSSFLSFLGKDPVFDILTLPTEKDFLKKK